MGHNIASTRHWIKQRVSSILLIPLTLLFIYNFLNVSTLSYDDVISNYKNLFHLCVAFLFITISIWHFYQGIEVVLEDYIHETHLRNSTLKILKILCSFLTLIITLAFIFLYRF